MTEETVTISKKLYRYFLESERWLTAYESAGATAMVHAEYYEELGGDNYEEELRG